jgi:hypothetical protein
MPCHECGASVDRSEAAQHECDRERWLDFKLFGLRHEVERFERQLGDWLVTPQGRFEAFYAARGRL